jgi:hypothetical protein
MFTQDLRFEIKESPISKEPRNIILQNYSDNIFIKALNGNIHLHTSKNLLSEFQNATLEGSQVSYQIQKSFLIKSDIYEISCKTNNLFCKTGFLCRVIENPLVLQCHSPSYQAILLQSQHGGICVKSHKNIILKSSNQDILLQSEQGNVSLSSPSSINIGEHYSDSETVIHNTLRLKGKFVFDGEDPIIEKQVTVIKKYDPMIFLHPSEQKEFGFYSILEDQKVGLLYLHEKQQFVLCNHFQRCPRTNRSQIVDLSSLAISNLHSSSIHVSGTLQTQDVHCGSLTVHKSLLLSNTNIDICHYFEDIILTTNVTTESLKAKPHKKKFQLSWMSYHFDISDLQMPELHLQGIHSRSTSIAGRMVHQIPALFFNDIHFQSSFSCTCHNSVLFDNCSGKLIISLQRSSIPQETLPIFLTFKHCHDLTVCIQTNEINRPPTVEFVLSNSYEIHFELLSLSEQTTPSQQRPSQEWIFHASHSVLFLHDPILDSVNVDTDTPETMFSAFHLYYTNEVIPCVIKATEENHNIYHLTRIEL